MRRRLLKKSELVLWLGEDGEKMGDVDQFEEQFEYEKWNVWSIASRGVSFKSRSTHLGDGEEKLAAEFDTIPLGQNSSYDMNILNDETGEVEKWEVKKLDNGTFNCAKNGRQAIGPVLKKIENCLMEAKRFLESLGESEENKTVLDLIDDIKDIGEICESKCKRGGRLERILLYVGQKKVEMGGQIRKVEVYHPKTGKKVEMDGVKFYKIANNWQMEEEELIEIYGKDYTKVKSLHELTHIYFEDVENLFRDLNELAKVFEGYVLVLVDKKKGFYPMKNPEEKISLKRITRGLPRFFVDI